MSSLETRRLFAAAVPSNYEQYLVELVNRARANPAAEAANDHIDLNEGLAAGTITTAAKQPLAINPYLTSSARGHSQWMIDNDVFAHQGAGGSQPDDRMTAAGYVFSGSWAWGENIAYRSTSGSINQTAFTAAIHDDLFIDKNIAGRGHRTNLMDPNFREIGAGIATGDFAGLNALMGTEDFAKSGSSVFLTGVAYADNVSDDNFYTPGEGLSGVTITAKRASDGVVIGTTTTWSSGGYSLPLPAGTYNVTASGGALAGTISYGNVVIASQNVKRDFTPDQLDAFATIANNKLTIVGTLGVDDIGLAMSGSNFVITRTGATQTLPSAGVTAVDIFGYDGDDYIHIASGVGGVPLGCYIDAGAGNDYIQGGDANDTITSGAGKDRAFGGLGDDRVAGNGGHDKLFGEAGKDRLYGGEGNDTLDGGSSADRMWGENGNNTYFGQGGNDYIYARNNLADVAYGGTGTDRAQTDAGAMDTLGAVEELLA
jgi:serralysin